MKLLYLALAAGAAAKCRKNDQCGGGEFCNVAKECEVCYYPGDIGTQNPACQRYVDACGYACDGSDYPAGGGDPAPGDDPAPPSGDVRDCADGEFDNDEECEACYFPGDLTLGTAVCDRYEDACHAACDGGSDAHSHTDSHADEEDPEEDGTALPADCCVGDGLPTMFGDVSRMECVWPTQNTNDRGDPPLDPVLSSPSLQFPGEPCTQHASYADCVGETSERCQWVFLASAAGGKCRVDPVSKCLEKGNCVCNTDDFGGGAGLGGGVLFHVPVSVTARDIAPDSLVTAYREAAAAPVEGTDTRHPRDESFFVSKVDFTAKTLTYDLRDAFPGDQTLLVKLHHLYRDQWLEGTVYAGPALKVEIDSSGAETIIKVNGVDYAFEKLKTWHCNQLAVTPSAVYLRNVAVERDLGSEAPPAAAGVTLGPFSGEAFDVRLYAGALTDGEVELVGGWCGDAGELKMYETLETPFLRGGCEPDVDPVPSDDGVQTYGTGAFGTLWVAPHEYDTQWWGPNAEEGYSMKPVGANADYNWVETDYEKGIYYDIPEEKLDLDQFFQELKLTQYTWERYYFELDLLPINLAPWYWYADAGKVPGFSERVWNNPCRYIHQHNNGWLYPYYGEGIPKYEGDDFDMGKLFHQRGKDGYGFVVHETFHGAQGEFMDTFGIIGTRWLAESTASYGADFAFPGADTYSAPYVVTPGVPLNLFFDVETSPHFLSDAMSIGDDIRGGHVYSAFPFWSFLANHAGLPNLVGKMYGTDVVDAERAGELVKLRALLHAEGLDLGDVFANFVAHLRTTDFPTGAAHATMLQNSFDAYNRATWASEACQFACGEGLDRATWRAGNVDDGYDDAHDCNWVAEDPAARCDTEGTGIFGTATLEDMQTTIKTGATEMVAGPRELRPGPFGWNAIKVEGVQGFVTVRVAWDALDTDDAENQWVEVNAIHDASDCPYDERFFSGRVVRVASDGARTYWKLDGYEASATVEVGDGDVLHVLLAPTPFADYVNDEWRVANGAPVPCYGYRYAVEVAESGTASAPAPMANGVMAYKDRGEWNVRCACTTDGNGPIADDLTLCFNPGFGAIENPPTPTAAPTTHDENLGTVLVTATATGITCDEFNATIYEEAIADALGTEDADYSDAACSDGGRRRLADGEEDDTVEIYSEVTVPGRAVPSGFNAQRYLMKQLQPERFQTRIHRTAARRGACGRRAPTNPANPCYNKTRPVGRRPPPGGQRRLMGDLTIIEVTTSTFAPTAAPYEEDDDDKGVNAAAGGAIGAGCAIFVVVALAVWYEASRRGGAKQQTAEPLKDLTPVAVEDPVDAI